MNIQFAEGMFGFFFIQTLNEFQNTHYIPFPKYISVFQILILAYNYDQAFMGHLWDSLGYRSTGFLQVSMQTIN